MIAHHTSHVTCRFLYRSFQFQLLTNASLPLLDMVQLSSMKRDVLHFQISDVVNLPLTHDKQMSQRLQQKSPTSPPPKKWDVNAVFCHHLLWLQSHFCQSLFAPKSAARQQAAHIALGIQPSHESAKLSRAACVRRRIALAFKEMGLTERTSTNKQTNKQTHMYALDMLFLDC